MTDENNTPETVEEQRANAINREDYDAFIAWKRKNEAEAAAKREAEAPAEYYVHLANGDVVRLNDTEFPDGTHAASVRHLVKDGYAHHVIGVYPVETKTTS